VTFVFAANERTCLFVKNPQESEAFGRKNEAKVGFYPFWATPKRIETDVATTVKSFSPHISWVLRKCDFIRLQKINVQN
jgi:hypothetical protein